MVRKENPSILETLFECAQQYRDDNSVRKAIVQEEIADLKAQIVKKQEELEAINSSQRSFANFQGKIGDNYQCPRCWMFDGILAWLSPVHSNTPLDFFSCNKCGTDFPGIPRETA
jgi:hypothetical protein